MRKLLAYLPAAALLAGVSGGAFAQEAAAAVAEVHKGDVAWIMTSTLLVLMMALPGLALFYGGMVRAKNMLSVLMQVMTVFSLNALLFAIYGYSLAFTEGNAFIGGFDRLFMNGVWDNVAGTFAPTKAVWSVDNRTAGFRVCGEDTRGIRVECRIGGADLNPYLACAALLAAGLDGIEQKLALEPEFSGDAYAAASVREIPRTLGEAAQALDGSAMLRSAMGDQVIDHYLRAAEWELEEQNRVVTDWELARGFERA